MLHDVAAIVSLLVDDDEVPHLYDVLDNDLAFQVNKKNMMSSTMTWPSKLIRRTMPIQLSSAPSTREAAS